jgi:hypothetical protein
MVFLTGEHLAAARADAGLGAGGEHGRECWQAVGMLPGVSLCRLVAEIRDFQDGQDCGVLADAAKMNLASQNIASG